MVHLKATVEISTSLNESINKPLKLTEYMNNIKKCIEDNTHSCYIIEEQMIRNIMINTIKKVNEEKNNFSLFLNKSTESTKTQKENDLLNAVNDYLNYTSLSTQLKIANIQIEIKKNDR